MFKKPPIDKAFISDIDVALAKFNQSRPLSPAQQAEAEKYKRIEQLRDHATAQKKVKAIWD